MFNNESTQNQLFFQCPDLAFTELHKLLTGKQYQLMPELLANYEKLCDKILVKKIDGLMDTINNLNKMLIDLPGQMSPLVNKSSPVGEYGKAWRYSRGGCKL